MLRKICDDIKDRCRVGWFPVRGGHHISRRLSTVRATCVSRVLKALAPWRLVIE
jgi:hypothetical protein